VLARWGARLSLNGDLSSLHTGPLDQAWQESVDDHTRNMTDDDAKGWVDEFGDQDTASAEQGPMGMGIDKVIAI